MSYWCPCDFNQYVWNRWIRTELDLLRGVCALGFLDGSRLLLKKLQQWLRCSPFLLCGNMVHVTMSFPLICLKYPKYRLQILHKIGTELYIEGTTCMFF